MKASECYPRTPSWKDCRTCLLAFGEAPLYSVCSGHSGQMEVQEGMADAILILFTFLANVRILTILERSNLMVIFLTTESF